MCDCLEKLHEELTPKINERFSKPKNPVAYFSINTTLGGRAVVKIGISLANQMKQVESFITAEYCPWCGQKYEGA